MEPAVKQLKRYVMLVDTHYGKMLINRYDIMQAPTLLKYGTSLDDGDIELLAMLLTQIEGELVIFDVGACYGCYSLGLHNYFYDRCKIYAFEPQRIIYNMLCGTVALNSIENIYCFNAAVGDEFHLSGGIDVPSFDYNRPLSFGSVEFGENQTEGLSQKRGESKERVSLIMVDKFVRDKDIERLNLLKIDVEGMEFAVLKGAEDSIRKFRPIMFIEFLKSDKEGLKKWLAVREYNVKELGINLLATPMEMGAVA